MKTLLFVIGVTQRIGVMGLGWIGHHEARLVTELSNAELVAGNDTDEEARAEFRDELGRPAVESHEELLDEYGDELDAVVIATPHGLHYEQAASALDAGISVLVEKPLVVDPVAASELVALADRRDALLTAGYQRRFHPGFKEIKRVVESGRLGDVHMVSCHVGQNWLEMNADSWRVDEESAGGGQLYDTGSHMLESLFWVCDLEPRSVSAMMEPRGQDVDVSTVLNATFDRNGDDVLASLAVCGDSTELYPDEGLTVWGTDGRLKYDKDGRLPHATERLRVVGSEGPAYTCEFTEGVDYYTLTRRKVERFVGAVAGTAENAVPGRWGLRLAKFRDAARKSWQTGRHVDVDDHFADVS